MEGESSLTVLQKLTGVLAGQHFGTWQFWTVWAVGLAIVLVVGKLFARGIGNSEKFFLTVFLGNALVILVSVAIAWAMLAFAGPHIEDTFTREIVCAAVAGLGGLIIILAFGPLFWAKSRIASLFSCSFAVGLGFAAMLATDLALDALNKGQSNVQEQRNSLEEAK